MTTDDHHGTGDDLRGHRRGTEAGTKLGRFVP
jgi:hypothetical protein